MLSEEWGQLLVFESLSEEFGWAQKGNLYEVSIALPNSPAGDLSHRQQRKSRAGTGSNPEGNSRAGLRSAERLAGRGKLSQARPPAAGAGEEEAMPPATRYARSGSVHIAYQMIGQGPMDLALVPGWLSHLESVWEEPGLARLLERLATFSRLILFDKRGDSTSSPSTSPAATLDLSPSVHHFSSAPSSAPYRHFHAYLSTRIPTAPDDGLIEGLGHGSPREVPVRPSHFEPSFCHPRITSQQ
jgi:hypothetical protein